MLQKITLKQYVWVLVSGRWSSLKQLLIIEKGLLERNAVLQSPSRIEDLVKIFIHATKVGSQLKIFLLKADLF
jgi:hypothetical protein